MEAILYILIFIAGTVFGSFLTLATYRIPLHQNIVYKQSYCPKCNHKLGFFDMIPVLSYFFLKGKCKYCKSKISFRYPLIEIICGISFVVLALGLKINAYTIFTTKGIEFALGILYIIFLFLVAGIDIEHREINKGVLIYGILIALLNIIYQYFTTNLLNLNIIIIYLIIITIMTILSILRIKKKNKKDYELSSVVLCIIINFFTLEIGTVLTIIYALLITAMKLLINKILNKGKKYNKNLPIASYICISNAIVWITIFLSQIGG